MSHTSCEGCAWFRESLVYRLACFRPKTMQSGRILEPSYGGFAAEFETHPASLYDGRADGDACGEERRHWRAA